ncbi:Glucose 6-phosphate N-acetyltransferase [Giardia muris]|uniref:Glucosamine 6-phosphate N-acetyltransferase n=1 Tax=Giardia muris TaxID=5742 RepID=A0A4Z1SPQ4_GIAMU|nr:Glucose 6-phosphate N-acetyltransferase [Giardia muris]|eukprot:TNJ27640.1 Glucose 6-phosphate N-acetyltransferase [Giardia muris]
MSTQVNSGDTVCICSCHQPREEGGRLEYPLVCERCRDAHPTGSTGVPPARVARLRTLTRHDLSDLCKLLSQLSTVGEVTEERLMAFYRDVASNDRHTVAVFEGDDGHVIGTATLLVEPKLLHGGSFVGHIEDVVIDQQYRGIGLGKLLITHLIDCARKDGCYKVILDCNDKTIGFYEKCGLEKHGNYMAMYF